jgi:2-keto-3-deoxy-6-phosphogluconate aldolase
MNKYKFRAECLIDVVKFLKCAHLLAYRIENIGYGFPDVEVTLFSKSDLTEIKRLMRQVPDGHVMIETLAGARVYTGDRVCQ